MDLPDRADVVLITRQEAIALGVADQRLTELVRRGVIARVARGIYSASSAPPDAVDPRVVTKAHKVVLSYESAAAWYAVDLPEPVGILHVTAPRSRGQRRDGIAGARLHRAHLPAGDVHVLRGVRVTSPLRTAVDIARHASIEHAVAITDSFLRARLLTAAAFVRAAAAAKGPGRARLQLVAKLVDPRSGSIPESLTRVLMWRQHLPAATTQYAFRHNGHLVGFFDFGWPDARAILECDGYEYHSARAPFQKDRRRWSAIGSSGWHLAVVTWFDVINEPEYVVSLVRDLIAIERGSSTRR